MLSRLAPFVVLHRRAILVVTALVVAVSGAIGGGVADKLNSGGFDDPSSESSRARVVLEHTFTAGQPNLALVVTTASGVDQPAAVRAGTALTTRLAREQGVTQVASYWTAGRPTAMRSADGDRAVVLALITGSDDEVRHRVEQLAPEYAGQQGDLTVQIGGMAQIYSEVSHNIETDLLRAELIAIPLTLLLLVLVFGSLVAALLPLAIALLSVMGSFLILTALVQVTPVSIFALNMVTALGLGLAIDYALFVVTRFREEIDGGAEVPQAIATTMRTAGRTVLFSSLTVALSLAAMVVFPLYFLRSFAYAGIAVVAFACVGALVVLPALLAVVGRNVDRWAFRKRRSAAATSGFWHRTALGVMRRPIPVATGVVLFLLLLGAPFLGLKLGLPDDRVLPSSAPAHQATQVLRDEFPAPATTALQVVAPDTGGATSARTGEYAARLSEVAHVERVDSAVGTYVGGRRVAGPGPLAAGFTAPGATWLSVVPDIEPLSADGERLTAAVRSLPAPYDVLVGGASAELVDTKSSISGMIPVAVALIGLATLVLLFLFTGSVVLPLKAVVLNLLSLTATFGAMVYVFQEGHLQWLVGDFTPTGTLDITTPILMFCIAFGLSMDYEVFLLSRIREEWLRTGDNTAAVARGLERTGRLVSAAAALIAIVFLAIGTSGVTFIKLFGFGMALAVIVDATIIRGALVPAFMRLAGHANWWAPAPLRRLHDRMGLHEGPEPPALPAIEREAVAVR